MRGALVKMKKFYKS